MGLTIAIMVLCLIEGLLHLKAQPRFSHRRFAIDPRAVLLALMFVAAMTITVAAAPGDMLAMIAVHPLAVASLVSGISFALALDAQHHQHRLKVRQGVDQIRRAAPPPFQPRRPSGFERFLAMIRRGVVSTDGDPRAASILA